jgi:electron transfer flavoprotein beta subunit
VKPLQLIVCVKQVPDPEGPADAFRVDTEAKKIIPVGIPPVINPFDENALEAALRIKNQFDAKVTVLSMGEKLAQPVLRKTLAAGADDLIILTDQHFKDLDSYSTAYVLSSSIKRLGAFDVILTGRQAADWDFGVTGLLIAEMLQIPVINLARKVEIKDGSLFIEKLCNDGYEVVKASMPALVTVSGELGELRYISVKALQASSKTPVKIFNAVDLELNLQRLMRRTIYNLFAFHEERECKFVEGESPQDKAENLVTLMKKEGMVQRIKGRGD